MAGTRSSPVSPLNTRLPKAQHKHVESETSTLQQATAMRPGKRRHQSAASPVNGRSESRSPRAKQRPVPSRHSPPTITAAPAVAATTPAVTTPNASSPQRSDSCSGSVSPSQLAVPRVTAEPPCPSQLPMPPVHWMAAEDQGPAQRQHCRAVTESLLSHLTSSGILVKA